MTDVIALPDHSQRGHSKLGASGAERWMKCPGSVALLKELQLDESDDPSYRKEGTCMHEAAELCLRDGLDTWEVTGQEFEGTVLTEAMAQAVQIYLDDCRKIMNQAVFHYIEYQISSPVHPDFYGTADFTALVAFHIAMADVGKPESWESPEEYLVVKDLKGGEGIIVEPEENPQIKYYAFGVIDGIEHSAGVTLRDDLKVLVGITQPRAFHVDGPIREWWTTVGAIKEWVHDTLVPAMAATEYDHSLDAGPWCRFCPAKLVCPMLTSLFRAAATCNPQEVVNYNNESLGRSYEKAQAVKFYLKALDEEVYRRLNKGETMEGSAKLVNKKSNRVGNPEYAAEAKKRFGDDALTPRELKSPAELEKLGPAAKAFVKEFAYQPFTGTRVATWDDPGLPVKVTSTKEAFGAAVANLGDET